MKYSIIVPVYNRPEEVDELLESLTEQRFRDFEVVIVEDGSSVPCRDIVEKYRDRLDIRYYAKPNSGPGQSRNYGASCPQVISKPSRRSFSPPLPMPSADRTGRTLLSAEYRKPSTTR